MPYFKGMKITCKTLIAAGLASASLLNAASQPKVELDIYSKRYSIDFASGSVLVELFTDFYNNSDYDLGKTTFALDPVDAPVSFYGADEKSTPALPGGEYANLDTRINPFWFTYSMNEPEEHFEMEFDIVGKKKSFFPYMKSAKFTAATGSVKGLSKRNRSNMEFFDENNHQMLIWEPDFWIAVDLPNSTASTEVVAEGHIDEDSRADYLLIDPTTGCWTTITWDENIRPVVREYKGVGWIRNFMGCADYDGDCKLEVLFSTVLTNMWGILDLDTGEISTQRKEKNLEYRASGDLDGDGDDDALFYNSGSHMYVVYRSDWVSFDYAEFEETNNQKFISLGDTNMDGVDEILINDRSHDRILALRTVGWDREVIIVCEDFDDSVFNPFNPQNRNMSYFGKGNFDTSGSSTDLVFKNGQSGFVVISLGATADQAVRYEGEFNPQGLMSWGYDIVDFDGDGIDEIFCGLPGYQEPVIRAQNFLWTAENGASEFWSHHVWSYYSVIRRSNWRY